MDSPRRTARIAGLLYLVSSIPGAFALLYVPRALHVAAGDAAGKAERLRASEGLVRVGIGAELASTVLFVFVALTLYRLFRPVAAGPAMAMLVLILLSVPISFLDVLTEIAALELAGAGESAKYLAAFTVPQREAFAYLAMHFHYLGICLAEIFWGLWLLPFGVCVVRSRFIPRALGFLLWIAAFGYLGRALGDLVLPRYSDAIGKVAGPLTILELPIILWLSIRGARPQAPRIAPAA